MARSSVGAGTRLASLPCVLVLLGVAAGPAKADCRALDGELRAAINAGAVDKFPALHKKMLAEPTCDGAYRGRVGRVLALAKLKHLKTTASGLGGTLAIGELERAAEFGRPWQVMTALGDAHYDAQDWAGAVRAYEAAIDDIRDAKANPKAPPKEIEQRLVKRAYQARALAPVYVATRRFRGRPGGLSSPAFRNFTAETVPVPVRFAYNESVLTADGENAAKDILSYLSDQKAARIRLIGHTDPRGSASYNIGLSLARAEAIKVYLITHGYHGHIEVVGKGEAHPFEPDDPAKYSDEQRFAFDRRVEYQILE